MKINWLLITITVLCLMGCNNGKSDANNASNLAETASQTLADDLTTPNQEANNIAATTEKTIFISGDHVNVRAESNLSAEVVSQLNTNTPVNELERVQGQAYKNNTEWVKIKLENGQTGFVHALFVSAEKSQKQTLCFAPKDNPFGKHAKIEINGNQVSGSYFIEASEGEYLFEGTKEGNLLHVQLTYHEMDQTYDQEDATFTLTGNALTIEDDTIYKHDCR